MRAKSLLAFGSGFCRPAGRMPRRLAIGEDEFLTPEDAFKYTATADEQNVTIEWQRHQGLLPL